MVALTVLDKCKIELDENKKENMVSEITKIAKDNITDIKRIERLVRYPVTGN
jgi:hypothetical protein